MLDPTQWRDVPLVVLIILGAYWVIQRHNDEYAKKLIELIGQFTEKYAELVKRAAEEREEARQRWMERDRQMAAMIGEMKEALVINAKETHTLRSTLQPLILRWEAEQLRRLREEGANAAD